MTILIHDTLATLFYAGPARNKWVESDLTFALRTELAARHVKPNDAALVPAAEMAILTETHQIVPGVAIVFPGDGPIAMRVPVRPDEVDLTPVALNGASGTAEILARATLEPFYGIRISDYLPESAEATVSLLEGTGTLMQIEAGYQENLVKAWFILTGQPVVSHVLATPKSWSPEETERVANGLAALRAAGHERRSELRLAAATEAGIDRDLLVPLFAGIRYKLEDADRRALIMLLQHGNKGSAYPYIWTVDYFERATASE
jgi:predicted solute-binding protein